MNKYKSNKAIDVNAFTLIELIVAIIIVSLTISWALPQFQRRIAQQQTKSFAQTLVSNLYALRARQGPMAPAANLVSMVNTILIIHLNLELSEIY